MRGTSHREPTGYALRVSADLHTSSAPRCDGSTRTRILTYGPTAACCARDRCESWPRPRNESSVAREGTDRGDGGTRRGLDRTRTGGAREGRAKPRGHRPHGCDQARSIHDAHRIVKERAGPVDVLVNNAAVLISESDDVL